ncbi:MAG: glucosyltransferase-I [Phycisphaerae bacterium]|nr:glucosyltransferase-I [Phycisphaerae bacterium]
MRTRLTSLMAMLVGYSGSVAPAGAEDAAWRWQNPLPCGESIEDVWFNGPNDAFLVGDTGTILHYDGSEFVTMHSGVRTDLEGIWASGPSDAFAVGKAGAILHYDGSAWVSVNGGTTENLWAVSGSGPNDVWAAGENRTILHYDGESWSVITTGTSAHTLYGAYAGGPNDVTFVDAAGTIVHFNGTDWSYGSLPSPYDLRMRDLWGNSPSDIYACGYRIVSMGSMTWFYAVIFHYDGASWTQLPQFEAGWTYVAVWASGPSNVYVAEGATVRRYDGSSWSTVTTGGMNLAIGGSGPADILVGGMQGQIRHFDGSTWSEVSADVAGAGAVYGVSGSARDNVFAAVGVYSPRTGKVLRYDGSAWSTCLNVVGYRLYDVWVAGSNAAFVVGESGNALRYDGSTWTTTPAGTTEHLCGLSGTGAADVFAVGGGGTVLHHDGTAWSAMSSPTGADLRDVWAASPNEVFAVGRSGTIIHYDGSSWATMAGGTSADLEGVWGSGPADVYAVGSSGAALHYDGSTWSSMISGTTKRLSDIWGAASDDVFAVGDNGTICHYDGLTWYPMVSPTGSALLAVFGTGPGSVHAVGSSGAILHYGACLLDVGVVNASFGQVSWAPAPTLTNPLRYALGTQVHLTATPNEGRSFVHWQIFDPNYPGDANYATIETSNPTVITMDTDQEVTAVFKCGAGIEPFFPIVAVMTVLSSLAVKRTRSRVSSTPSKRHPDASESP